MMEFVTEIFNSLDPSSPWQGFLGAIIILAYLAFCASLILIPFRIGGIREDIRKIRKIMEDK